jgi:excisionase family DNA binding protein
MLNGERSRTEAARPPAYASLSEAAAYTRLSRRTLQRAVSGGTLRAHRVGSRLIFDYAALDSFVRGEGPAAAHGGGG